MHPDACLSSCRAIFASVRYGRDTASKQMTLQVSCTRLAVSGVELLTVLLGLSQTLQEARALQIPRRIASEVIYGLRQRTPGYTSLLSPCAGSYELLMALHRAGCLEFDLAQVVQEIVAYLSKGIE